MRTRFKRVALSGRAGQAVVEFALILPVFVLLVYGALEFGRAFYEMHLLTNAAREGARTAALPGKTESDVTQVVDDFLNGVALSGGWSTEVLATRDGAPVDFADAREGDQMQVTVNHDFEVLVGAVLPGFSGTVAISGRCIFRHE